MVRLYDRDSFRREVTADPGGSALAADTVHGLLGRHGHKTDGLGGQTASLRGSCVENVGVAIHLRSVFTAPAKPGLFNIYIGAI